MASLKTLLLSYVALAVVMTDLVPEIKAIGTVANEKQGDQTMTAGDMVNAPKVEELPFKALQTSGKQPSLLNRSNSLLMCVMLPIAFFWRVFTLNPVNRFTWWRDRNFKKPDCLIWPENWTSWGQAKGGKKCDWTIYCQCIRQESQSFIWRSEIDDWWGGRGSVWVLWAQT